MRGLEGVQELGGRRWRWIGVALALSLVGATTFACASDELSPVEVARAFASATAANDVKAMLPLVERDAVRRLEAAAELASDHVGGRRNIEAWEMLQVAEVDRMGSIVKAELVDEDGTVAHVKLVRADGGDHVIELVHEEGAWRVRLSSPVIEPSSPAQ